MSAATKAGLVPILDGAVASLLAESDLLLAEPSVAANLTLIEGVVREHPDDVKLRTLAAMARSTYAYAFLQDELEALRLERPGDRSAQAALRARAKQHYGTARAHAEAALDRRAGWRAALGGATLEGAESEAFDSALSALHPEDAEALFWLGFAWGGALQVELDPAAATALPKVEALARRLLELNEAAFLGLGPHLLSGVLLGFRSPALGGDPAGAGRHFERARELSGTLLPDVLLAQYVYAQTEAFEPFTATLTAVIDAPGRPDRALLDALARRKACRLLANLDQLFLEDAEPAPEACDRIPRRHPFRTEPMEVAP